VKNVCCKPVIVSLISLKLMGTNLAQSFNFRVKKYRWVDIMHGKCFVIFLMLLLLTSLSSYALTSSADSEVHDVAVTNVTAFPKRILIMGIVTINVTVANMGNYYETFNVTIYAGNHILTYPHLTVSNLAPGTTATLTIKWDLFPVIVMIFPPPWPWPPCKPMVENLTIWAEAGPVVGEMNVSNNIYIDGTVSISWWPVDVNGDGIIDILDIATICYAFGSHLGDPRYDPMLDFNSDGQIDILDIAGGAMNFGATYT
jgi:hypothetical protein